MSEYRLMPAQGEDWDYVHHCLVEAHCENELPGAVAKPREQVKEEARFFLDPHRPKGLRSVLKAGGPRPPHQAFLALDREGGRAGCLLLGVNQELGPGTAWVYLIYVEPGHRRRGLAGEMLAKAEAWGRERGMGALMLSAKSGNQVAMRLYSSAGLQPVKVWLRKPL